MLNALFGSGPFGCRLGMALLRLKSDRPLITAPTAGEEIVGVPANELAYVGVGRGGCAKYSLPADDRRGDGARRSL